MPSIIQLSGLNGSNGFQISGEAGGQNAGFSLASLGDINGDGFDDVIIGSNGYDGISWVVFGAASGLPSNLNLSTLDGTRGFQLNGTGGAGRSVGGAGDVNDDGFDDIIVGARSFGSGGAYNGAAFVIFGKASAFAANLDIATVNGANGFRITGEANYDAAGYSVSSAGDFNGDGIDDLLIGASNHDGNGANSGAAYIVFGKTTAFAANLDLSTLNGANGFQITGALADLRFGRQAAAAGDVNGDGYGDIIVGSFAADYTGTNSGSTWVLFGAAGGFPVNFNLDDLDGTNGFRLDGVAAQDQSGVKVSSAGDVNNDGYDDLLIGANLADPNGSASGAVYVVFGKASGFASITQLSSLNGADGFRISGVSSNDFVGEGVAAAGDVNNDGYDDILVGGTAAGATSTGEAYLIYGRASGFAANLNLSDLNGFNGFTIVGEAVADAAGRSVSSAGDFNGDGFADLLVGADFADPNGATSGAAYILFGQPTGSEFVGNAGDESYTGSAYGDRILGGGGKDQLDGADGDDELDGGDGNDVLFGGAGLDDIVGGAGNDLLQGGDGDDSLSDVSGANKLYGGAGMDTLTGGSGADRLDGGTENDTLNGGGGNDYLDGGAGSNSLIGGTGNDIFIVRSLQDSVTESINQGTDTVRSMVSYTLGANVEVLELLGGTNIDGDGNGLANTLKGNGGNNVLVGHAGADKLFGEGGSDVLYGGEGRDQLTGGSGADQFIFTQADIAASLQIDNVLDYEIGVDELVFLPIDADGNAANGDTAFTLSFTGLTRTAGEIYVFYAAAEDVTVVRLDQNGDGRADFQVKVNGDVTGDTAGWLL